MRQRDRELVARRDEHGWNKRLQQHPARLELDVRCLERELAAANNDIQLDGFLHDDPARVELDVRRGNRKLAAAKVATNAAVPRTD